MTSSRLGVTVACVERAATAVTVGAMLATPFAARGGRARRVLTTATVVGGAVRTFAVEVQGQGPRRATTTASATIALASAAEVVGVRTGLPFGRYSYTTALRPRIAGVPIVVPLAWYAVAIPAHDTAGAALGRRSTRSARVGAGALALTAWDLFLDPQMTAEGYWRWAGTGWYRGIPIRNFVGWAAVAVVVMTVTDTGRGRDPERSSHIATYAGLATLETVAFATFWRDRTVALVGGASMLPISALALVRRTAGPAPLRPRLPCVRRRWQDRRR